MSRVDSIYDCLKDNIVSRVDSRCDCLKDNIVSRVDSRYDCSKDNIVSRVDSRCDCLKDNIESRVDSSYDCLKDNIVSRAALANGIYLQLSQNSHIFYFLQYDINSVNVFSYRGTHTSVCSTTTQTFT